MTKEIDKFDHYAKGKEDRENARPADWMDIVTWGFGSGNYHPPSDPAHREAYDRGWKGKK